MNFKKLTLFIPVALIALAFVFGSCSSTPQHLADAKASYTIYPSNSSKNKKITNNASRKKDKHTNPPPKNYILKKKKSKPIW